MRLLELNDVADYLEVAAIEKTIRNGFNIIHFGRGISGTKFTLINNANGESVLYEEL